MADTEKMSKDPAIKPATNCHHARAAEPAITQPESSLNNEKVKYIAIDLCSLAIDVTEKVQRNEANSKNREYEKRDRPWLCMER
ncbi:hypothetical protein BOTNAR_0200g00110 [Botryotinia narcissicola]|uniref:Uncharacterized protein n=1 Tax=Botryotinia narcissicola TaxID=278944 RepID=A0A4Z1I839_9HELO|nr:hypothetical protein BOTNAR_0200g00110 [Botryotinia narcissicola]